MFGRDSGRIELNHRPVGDEITPRPQAIVEMVGGDVSQVSKHSRQQQRVIIGESHYQEPGE